MLMLMSVTSATAQEDEARECSRRGCYVAPMLSKFHRGFVNVAFSWMEIPREIQAKGSMPCGKGCCGLLRNPTVCTAHALVSGTAMGAVKGGFRAVGGAFEMALAPLPPYGPVMEPPYPRPLVFNPPCTPAPAMDKVAACGMAAGCQQACPMQMSRCPKAGKCKMNCGAAKCRGWVEGRRGACQKACPKSEREPMKKQQKDQKPQGAGCCPMSK